MERLHPAYFALLMATGIVAVASRVFVSLAPAAWTAAFLGLLRSRLRFLKVPAHATA